MNKALVLSLFLSMVNIFGRAQSAVYVCSSTGAFGYCYGSSNATNCAYNKCISRGGISPYLILNYCGKGHGAIALGKTIYGRYIIGAAAGHQKKATAISQAIAKCLYYGGQRPTIYILWIDK